jgi:hypothetical protein
MKLGVTIAALIGVLTLGALGVTTQSPSGWATARWTKVDSVTTKMMGSMFNMKGEPAYSFRAQMYGRAAGNFTGVMGEVPWHGRVSYTLFGNYAPSPDGRTAVRAWIFLRGAGPMFVILGKFEGVLDPNPRADADTWMPLPNDKGHFHGRWWLN